MFREVGDQRGAASTLGNLGNVLVEMGDLTAARKHYDEGLKIQRETGYRRGQAYAMSNLADLLTVTGDFPQARKLAEQALALRKELGENTNVAISQLQMGWIAFNEARLNEAESSLRDAAQVFQKADMRDLLISSNALLARVLLAEGKTAEAGRLAADAVQMAKSPVRRGLHSSMPGWRWPAYKRRRESLPMRRRLRRKCLVWHRATDIPAIRWSRVWWSQKCLLSQAKRRGRASRLRICKRTLALRAMAGLSVRLPSSLRFESRQRRSRRWGSLLCRATAPRLELRRTGRSQRLGWRPEGLPLASHGVRSA